MFQARPILLPQLRRSFILFAIIASFWSWLSATCRPASAQELLVTSYFGNSILQYDGITGAFLNTLVPSGSGGLVRPLRLTIGPDRNLYVTGVLAPNVLRFNGMTGAFIDVFVPADNGGYPVDLAFGPDGNLYVLRNDYSGGSFIGNSIRRYNGAIGAFIDVFIPDGSGSPDVAGISQFVFRPDGFLYAAGTPTNNVARFDAVTGTYRGIFASSDLLSDPETFVFGPDGNLYVASTHLAHAGNVVRFNGATGAFMDVFIPQGSGGLSAPNFILFGPDGNLYISDDASGRSGDPNSNIKRFNGTTGAFIDVFVPASSGGLNDPGGFVFRLSPRAIFNVNAQPGNTGALITWNTNIPASSRIEYGTTPTYTSSVSSASLVTSHTINLSNLASVTGYHYRVSSTDTNGNKLVSGDYTFTTGSTVYGAGGAFSYILQRLNDGRYQVNGTFSYPKDNSALFQEDLIDTSLDYAQLGAASQPAFPPLPVFVGPGGTMHPGDTEPFSLIFPASAGSPSSTVKLFFQVDYSDFLNNRLPSYGSFRVRLP